MADPIVEMLKGRKADLEAQLRQVTTALNVFIPATKEATAVIAKPARKPMSEEAKTNMRNAQLRRHHPQTNQTKVSEPAQPTIPTPSWKASE